MNENIFRVDFQGILSILSKHLYSTEEIFIRELLQNAVDAIALRNIEFQSSIRGEVNVELVKSEDKHIIIFEDNGNGLTLEEVEKFLSVIGSSSKKELINRNDSSNTFIGQFGIGLLSCFMVSEKITLISKSEKSERAVKWEASINGTYTSKELQEEHIQTGTKIFLVLNKEKGQKYTFEFLKKLLTKYSQFLDLDVNLVYQESHYAIPQSMFPWDQPEGVSNDEMLDFGRKYFNIKFNHFIPLSSHDGKTKGIGYIYPFSTDAGSKQVNHVYIKNMLIDEKCDKVLPEWAFFMKAIINSEVLVPTASREGIYNDNSLIETRVNFEKSIRDYFQRIATNATSILEDIIKTHSLAIKAFAVTDNDFFDLIIDHISFPTSKGYIKGNELYGEKHVKYVEDIDQFRQLLPIAKANKELIINGGYIYDTTLLSKLAKKPEIQLSVLDDIRFENLLDEVNWEEENAYSLFRQKAIDVLSDFRCVPVLKKYKPLSLPAIYHSNRNHNLSREIDRTKSLSSELWSGMLDELTNDASYNESATLYLNIDNELVKKIISIEDEDVFVKCIELIYVNALLIGHYTLNELESSKLNNNLLAILQLAI